MEEELEDGDRTALARWRLYRNLEAEFKELIDNMCERDMCEKASTALARWRLYWNVDAKLKALKDDLSERATVVLDMSQTPLSIDDYRDIYMSESEREGLERERAAREREAREREAREREASEFEVHSAEELNREDNGIIKQFQCNELYTKFEITQPIILCILDTGLSPKEVLMANQRSRNPGFHAVDTMCNLPSNSCGHYVCNCESQSPINKRTTYDKYNRPIGANRLSYQQQSDSTHEQNETLQALYHVSHHEPLISLNSDTHEILSHRTPNQITNRRRYDNYNRPIEPSYQSDTQRKQNEKDKLQIMHCKPETRHQIPGCDQGQIPNRTSKTLVATLCLQSSISKFNVNNLSKEEPPRAVLPSRAVLLASFIAAAMLPYITLLVSNLTSVQRTYTGLWRPNELCNY